MNSMNSMNYYMVGQTQIRMINGGRNEFSVLYCFGLLRSRAGMYKQRIHMV